ncbi:MAG: hypothetical protein IPF92_02155 [Myxococcales bacterium]|nr:hypothetical protein [Myxococcales bacterium]HQY61790.1 hypothetical protein [Polyangiaceae bacterium]
MKPGAPPDAGRSASRARGRGLAALLALGSLALGAGAAADGFDPRAPHAVVVGAPRGAAPVVRVNAARDGLTQDPLPSKKLHVAWRKSTGAPLEGPPVVDERGRVIVAGARGDVVVLSPDGVELSRAATGAQGAGPLALTADGTAVFTTSSGDVVGARGATRRFLVHAGAPSSFKVAPLPMRDGGFVVAVGAALVLLDTEGQERARAHGPEPFVGTLVAVGARVLGASRGGTVFSWSPGGEIVRVGSFRAPLDGGLTVEDGVRLLAVTDGRQVTELDLARGATRPRGTAPQGSIYLGPLALSRGYIVLQGVGLGSTYLVVLDRTGRETRVPFGPSSPTLIPLLPDGGTPPLVAPPHTGALVDARGTIAFLTPTGVVGVSSPESGTSTLAEPVCGPSVGRLAVIPGLAPAGPQAFVVACENGAVVKVVGE